MPFHWCGLRPSVLGPDPSEIKKSVSVLHAVILVLQVWCCVLKHDLVTLVDIMILKDTATFQVLFIVSLYYVLGTSLLWRSTVAFTYLKVKSAKCLCLLPMVLVLLSWSWSCLHHWYFYWHTGAYFGRMPSCHHQWLICAPTEVEPRLTRHMSVALTTRPRHAAF